MRPVCLFRRSSSYWSIETSSRALVLAVREFGFVKLLHLLGNAKLWSSSVLLLIFASSSSSSSFDPRGSAPSSRRRTRRRGGTSSSSMVPAGRSAALVVVFVVVVLVAVTTARRPVLTTTRIVFLSLFFSTSASSFSSSSESMMVLILFSFFFSSSKSFSSSSPALLRDLVVVLVVAAQFAVRIGNGFRSIIRIRLVRPHLSKLLYVCTCATLYCRFRVFFFQCCSPFKESFECTRRLYRRGVSDVTFPHFSISLLSGLDSSERERERNDRDVLVCPTLGFRRHIVLLDPRRNRINKRLCLRTQRREKTRTRRYKSAVHY